VHKIEQHLPGLSLRDRPDYYPSFHQSVGRWPGGVDRAALEQGREPKQKESDVVFEADLPTWHDAFRDVYAALHLMDRHDVRYLLKFSGHRSLHVVIPAEGLPDRYRGKGTKKLVMRLIRWAGSQAHHLPKITRMPYSLNEDTGLACLPIARGTLSRFRPWQANLHLVEVDGTWDESSTDQDRARMEGFLDVLKTLDTDGSGRLEMRKNSASLVPDRRRIAEEYRGRLAALRGRGAVGPAWTLLASDQELSEQVLVDGLESPEPDVRWLTAEAFLLNGTGLSQSGFIRLLEQQEEYVSPAAVDILLRFGEHILPYLIQVMGDLDRYPRVRARATYLLTQSEPLREQVFAAILQNTDRSRDALIAAACLTGSVAGDWPAAFHLVEPVRSARDLSAKHRAELAALEIMGTLGGWDKREEAKKSQMLAELGSEVTDLLLIAAASPHRRFRRGIVGALAVLADPRAVGLLIRSLADDYSKIRRKALTGLIRIGEAAVDPLIEATASDQVPVRRYAVHCLGCIGTPRGRPFVLQALDDSEDVVRRQAIRALQNVATEDDVERLQRFLRDEPFENAEQAVDILEAIGPLGIQAMREMALAERNPAAAYYIARQGDARGREILVERLREGDEKRADAAEFLRELRDARCVPFFADVLKTITHWRGAFIAHELGRIGTPEAVAALVATLSRENSHVRRGALRGLAVAKDPIAIESLIRCLNADDDTKARGLAATALAEIGDPAIEPLREALQSGRIRDRHRRKLLIGVLAKLGEEYDAPN
jgi:HEAT repeat protein